MFDRIKKFVYDFFQPFAGLWFTVNAMGIIFFHNVLYENFRRGQKIGEEKLRGVSFKSKGVKK
jgi:hypothetical protein